MLYHLYDLNQAAMKPARLWAQMMQTVFQHPFVPASWTRMGRSLGAMGELVERTTRRFAKPAFGLDTTMIGGREVDVFEETVLCKPFANLLRFRRDTNRKDPKVLIVAPMSGHHATLLRGTVKAMLPHHDVYITDWIDARFIPLSRGRFDLDDYIDYVMDFLHVLGPDTHVIAVCQPAVPVMAAVSLLAAEDSPVQPRTMTLMGGPIDTAAAQTQVTKLAEDRPLSWFANSVVHTVPAWYPGAFRRVYPGFIQLAGFMTMNLDRHISQHVKLFEHLTQGDGESAEGHRKFYDEYLAVMDLPAEFYLQTVDVVFQKRALANGTWVSRGRQVDPGAIRKTALLTVEGELDDISAPGQTRAAHDLVTNLPKTMQADYLQKGVGHYGIFNGRKWREAVQPRIEAWIRKFDDSCDPLPGSKKQAAAPKPISVAGKDVSPREPGVPKKGAGKAAAKDAGRQRKLEKAG